MIYDVLAVQIIYYGTEGVYYTEGFKKYCFIYLCETKNIWFIFHTQ
jgi:hypothetical protein